jgi:hypothetical protein
MTPLLPQQALAGLPAQLRKELVGEFAKIVQNYAEGRWEPAELNGGKLSEAAYSVCEGLVTGTMPSRAAKPRSMVDACRALEKSAGGSAPHSARILIPRMLPALYDIRNNRSVGHLGGDVDPNHMDSLFVLQTAKWIMGEFIRILHKLPVDEAANLVDALVERETPLVWKVDGRKRVLDPKMTMPDKTLLFLHSTPGPVSESDLIEWTEHTEARLFRRDVLRRAHRAKLVEYDADAKLVTISPLGIARVEQKIIKRANR